MLLSTVAVVQRAVYARPRLALDERTPGEAVGIFIEGDNKGKTPIHDTRVSNLKEVTR